MVIYIKSEDISTTITDFLNKENTVEVKDSNIYKRNYDYIKFTNTNDFTPYNKEDILNIYYNIVNNGWDEFTFYCPKEYTNCTNDINIMANDRELMSKVNNYVHPFNSFVTLNTKISSNGQINVEVIHKYNEEKISIIDNKVNEIISNLVLYNKTDYEKISLIHNYIINNSTYDNDKINKTSPYDSTSAYGNLIEGYSVCSGYSDTLSIFLDKFNIPNIKISSKNHVWNLIYFNGKWLHIDLTWDDTDDNRLKNNYFLITKEELYRKDKTEHTFDEDFFIEAY